MKSKENSNNNIVHEWRIVETPSKKDIFLEDYNHCSLCGEELLYTHVTDFRFNQVEEEAECLSCGVRHKKNQHILN